MTAIRQLQSDTSDIGRTRIVTTEAAPLGDGEVLMKIDRVAVTSNNITYAAFGKVPHLRYWDFYPTGDDGWFHMPAWGFADVQASRVDGVAVGERFYGFWPVASHVRMQPVRVSERGFYDGAAHRLELTSAYNQYQRVTTDAAYRAQDEDYQMLLRPLFITSWMLADFLQDNGYFGARRVVVSSASSKTAYGTVFCMQDDESVEVVGLTSGGSVAFVDGLGCYDRTLSYDAVTTLGADVPTVYVDFSGNNDLRRRIHAHLGAALVYSCYAGSAQSQDHISQAPTDLPGPKPQPYFAPYQIKKRNADWGAAEVTRRFNEAQRAFIRRVGDAERPWMRIEQHLGLDAAGRLVEALVAGQVDPRAGHAVLL